MSGKAARSYSHTSNRAKARTAIERKDGFKSVLENPFRIQWPSIPQNAQNMFLETLIATLGTTVKRRTRKPKPVKAGANEALPRLQTANLVDGAIPDSEPMVECSKSSPPSNGPTSSPVIDNLAPPSDYITVGINEVTRRLESQVKSFRKSVTLTTACPANPIPSITAVFVCRADVNPPILLEHIPHLVAGCNPTCPESDPRQPLKLIVLPKGSEPALAQVLGLRRAAVIAIHDNAPYLPTFCNMLQSVPAISAPWLAAPFQSASPRSLIPTHIKQLRTSTPKDMKVAKEQRAKARAAAKKSSAKPGPKKRVVLTTEGSNT